MHKRAALTAAVKWKIVLSQINVVYIKTTTTAATAMATPRARRRSTLIDDVDVVSHMLLVGRYVMLPLASSCVLICGAQCITTPIVLVSSYERGMLLQ